MNLLFCIALPNELKIIKQEIKNLELKWVKIDFLPTGVWVLNTIYSIKNYIQEKNKPDFIINIWVCWKNNSDFSDFFQVYRIKNLSNNKEAICPLYIENSILKSIVCSDKIVTDINELWEEKIVDMESFWIDFICDKEKIPYIIIKKPFDLISKDSLKVDIKDLENSLKWFDWEKLIQQILVFQRQNEENKEIQNITKLIKEKHKLTFSEVEFLKKYINKNLAFWNNLEKIFESLHRYDKKEILKYIKE